MTPVTVTPGDTSRSPRSLVSKPYQSSHFTILSSRHGRSPEHARRYGFKTLVAILGMREKGTIFHVWTDNSTKTTCQRRLTFRQILIIALCY